MSIGGRRRSIVAADSSRPPSIDGSTTTALRSPFGPRRSADDFRPLQAHFRKRSSAEQSLTSFRIGSNDDDLVEEEEEEADFEEQRLDEDEDSKTNSGDRDVTVGPPSTCPADTDIKVSSATAAGKTSAALTATTTGTASKADKKRLSLKRNHTGDSEVERRVAKLLYEIKYSGTDSVDESKIQSRCSVGETTTATTSTSTSTTNGALKTEVETQTMTEQELAAMQLQSSQGTMTSWSSSSVGVTSYMTSSSNNDVISGESSITDMATGATGGNEGWSAAAPSGRRFRLLPSLHNVLFPGCGRQRRLSTGKQSTVTGTSPLPRPPSAPGAVPPFN